MSVALLDLTVLRTDVRHFGIGRYLVDLTRGLAKLGAASPGVRVLTQLPWAGTPAVAAPGEAALAELRQSAIVRQGRWAWRARLRLAAAARQAGAALLHTGHPRAVPVGLDCPRVVTCHDLIPLRYPSEYLGHGFTWGQLAADAYRYRSAAHVIAVSMATADDLVRLVGVPARRITVVHPGLDRSAWSPEPHPEDDAVRSRLGVAGAPYALYVGADDWRKNFPTMLEALAVARRRVPELRLVWAGKPAAKRLGPIVARARDLGVADALVRLGHVGDDELCALYRGARCLLFVSRIEGFGYPLVEAMASGCPVICSAGSSLGEVAGDAAWLVDPSRAAAAAEAMVTLARSDVERRRLAARGQERAGRFELGRMAAETHRVYQQVLR